MSYTNPPYYLTAYGLAVKQGFKGSLDEWLNSLIGPPGPAGKSAYECARDGGYTGTEAEFTMQMARELNAVQVTESMASHMASKENPHSVTAVQIGAAESGHSHKTMDDHVASKENPHGVTAQQIGAAETGHGHKATDIEDVIPMSGGGTGARNGADGLANMLAAGNLKLSSKQIVEALPDAANLADGTCMLLLIQEMN